LRNDLLVLKIKLILIKLCKDCKHYKRDWGARLTGYGDTFDLCLHPLVTENVVTGKSNGIIVIMCESIIMWNGRKVLGGTEIMKVYDYRIVEDLNLKTLKPYFYIQYYHLTEKKYYPYSDDTFQTLQEAQEAIRLLRKYKEPVYHYVE
jgi:hypothetical protein